MNEDHGVCSERKLDLACWCAKVFGEATIDYCDYISFNFRTLIYNCQSAQTRAKRTLWVLILSYMRFLMNTGHLTLFVFLFICTVISSDASKRKRGGLIWSSMICSLILEHDQVSSVAKACWVFEVNERYYRIIILYFSPKFLHSYQEYSQKQVT